MIYLSGSPAPEFGIVLHPRMRLDHLAGLAAEHGRPWIAENGCFAQGDSFDGAAWLDWLERMPRRGCLFAVAPDKLADPRATIVRSAPYLPTIRRLGYPAAFVAQDGLMARMVPWDSFDCFFVGGSTGWKLSEAAYDLAAEAQRRKKWVHMGRVNTLRRLRAAAAAGFDSVDGTFIAYARRKSGHGNVAQLHRWLATVANPLPFAEVAA